MYHKTVCELRDLTYVYPGEAADDTEAPGAALKDITLSIHEGEWVALLGANGSGKSTLAKHLNALLTPSQGECIVYGLNTADEDNTFAIRSSVAMVFQHPENQIVGTVVEEDAAFGPEHLGIPPEEIGRRVEKALSDAGLLEKRKKPTYTLSGGEKQRLAVAGALAMNTPCIVLDEPTAMLDPEGRSALLDVLAKLHHEGRTIIYITHRLEETALCDRAVILHEGRIAWDGPSGEVFLADLPLEKWGIDVPPLVSLWKELKAESWPVPPAPTVAAMADALCP
ncbi:MAG: ATP-binding cassette domain-containing protein [Synergistaceae bacterium]|nr:ATP-binding cassette domain-containing protein [Synergistaceae bacterium]